MFLITCCATFVFCIINAVNNVRVNYFYHRIPTFAPPCIYNTEIRVTCTQAFAESLINQNARSLNGINGNGVGNFLIVYSVFNANKFCLIYLITRSSFVHFYPFPDSEL